VSTKPPKRRDEQTTDRARALRHDSTFPERLLWSVLRNRRLGGLKFRRQKPAQSFVVDFCSVEHKLIVELDGLTHVGTGEKDDTRSRILERGGYRVIRFTNDEILHDLEAVADAILREAHPLSVSSRSGEGGRVVEPGRGDLGIP
jgi:very-short-patch-repair endonuclease